MYSEKITTMIVNATEQELVMKVGSRNVFLPLANVQAGGEYAMRLCMNWAFQVFVLEDPESAGKKLLVNSDDCCDYERLTVKESSEGQLVVDRIPRMRFSACIEVEEITVVPQKPFWRFWLCWL